MMKMTDEEFRNQKMGGEVKSLDIGIGVADLTNGFVTLNVYSSGYTRSELMQAMAKAQAVIKNELDANNEAWNMYKDLAQQRAQQLKEKA